jgi:predicted DNA-binding transcriptional regulator AlpA
MSLLKPRKPATPATVQATVSAPAFEERMLRIAETAHMVALGKSTIYTLIRAGRFPPPTKHTARASVWKLSEVQAFIRGEYAPLQPARAPVVQLVRQPSKGGNHG